MFDNFMRPLDLGFLKLRKEQIEALRESYLNTYPEIRAFWEKARKVEQLPLIPADTE